MQREMNVSLDPKDLLKPYRVRTRLDPLLVPFVTLPYYRLAEYLDRFFCCSRSVLLEIKSTFYLLAIKVPSLSINPPMVLAAAPDCVPQGPRPW